jgi:hypothetical protein
MLSWPSAQPALGLDYAAIEIKVIIKCRYGDVAKTREDMGTKCVSNVCGFKDTR